jgi:hypothetical protein
MLIHSTISPGGYKQSVSWKLLVDNTVPASKEVIAARGAGIWGRDDGVTCTWGMASDAESGIVGYEVAIVRVSHNADIECIGERSDWDTALGGLALTVQERSCAELEANLTVSLMHGGSYRCAVWAINGAGMRSVPRLSRDFVVDTSDIIGPPRRLLLMDNDPEVRLGFITNLSIKIEFEAFTDEQRGNAGTGYPWAAAPSLVSMPEYFLFQLIRFSKGP